MKNVAILGSTGTIGRNTLEIIERQKGLFRVVALAAGSNARLLEEQAKKFRPKIISLNKKKEAEILKQKLKEFSLKVTFGQEGAEEAAGFPENDIIVSAITGINGLRPTLAAVRTGKVVALANKESMVVAGPLIREEARRSGAQIIPIDSEHSGIFQCLAKEENDAVHKVILTASGGPFFRTPLQDIQNKSLEEALAHPRWKMGKKVTVDSATLMNKGLELIEARWLFNLEPQKLSILIHPQSIVHSLVEMRDGSVLAQLSPTDMKIPIQYALTYPQRKDSLIPPLDLVKIKSLEFYPVEEARYPLVALAFGALREGESRPVALNAANEVAVSAFLDRRIRFPDISTVIRGAMDGHQVESVRSLEEIFEVDRKMREKTFNFIKQRHE
ncbi:MAG: 1-deoxy-D-xylulose-5-phosphate reductoisomerase [Candidatus Aminicenantales bacterium]